ncbi:histidine kinase [Paenibacillus sp. JX-17]|uniref:Histidine kinase n=1 Tax=Paenibacillus lacisoli TaxID=3064525 RepID=A0ABT9CF35_9BACL|nr:histidine kinase [Paenibacillus sp. JX-17]MDO7907892.1 histidine kinase [Paenibacillus sp. JX-17]
MFQKLVRLTNDMRMRHKLLLAFIFIVMIPVLVIGGGVVAYMRQQALDSAVAQTTNNVDKIKSQAANLLRVPTDISNLFMFDSELKEIVNKRYKNMVELTNAYLGFHRFEEYTRQYREVANIRFYSFNDTLVNNLEFIPINSQTESEEWFKATRKTSAIGWFYVHDPEDNPMNRLSLVRKITFPEYRTSGVLMIGINQSELNSMLSQEPFETLIADQLGYVVAAKNPSMVGKTLKELNLGFNLSTIKDKTFKAKVGGVPSNIVVDELMPVSSMSGLKIISVFSTESIVKDANRVSLIGLLMILTILIIGLVLVQMVSYLITKRLLRLSRHLNKVARGNFNIVARIDGNDEIGQLSRQFNYMVASINQLMNQVYETSEKNSKLELAQKEITLKMMASQINPHFLFNALESIRMKAHMKGEKEIANIVRLLGKLMRGNLEIGSGKTTIKQEMELVRSYLEIQKFRYDDRLRYDIHMDPEVMGVLIPPLIIQPLVENSIVHGLENKEGGVYIEIMIRMEHDRIAVRVSDNGRGMTPERREEVIAFVTSEEEEEKSRIGLRNVHQRLTLFYGEEYGLVIRSVPEEGTEISFAVPREGEPYVQSINSR